MHKEPDIDYRLASMSLPEQDNYMERLAIILEGSSGMELEAARALAEKCVREESRRYWQKRGYNL